MSTQPKPSPAILSSSYGDERSLLVASPSLRPKCGLFGKILCRLLEEHRVRYCLIGATEDPSYAPDVAVNPADCRRLRRVFEPLRREGYVAVQYTPFAVASYRFCFADLRQPQVHFVCINVVYRHRGQGLRWENTAGLVQRRVWREDHWGLSTRDEFAYWLGRSSIKEWLDTHHERKLQELVTELGWEDAEEIAGRIYTEDRKNEVVRACAEGTIQKLVTSWKDEMKRGVLLRQPAYEIAHALREGWRFVRRWLKPSGLFLALLGPDGVGKSTTTANIRRELKPLFPEQREFHWRPQLLMPRPEDPPPGDRNSRTQELFSQNRHGDPPRGFLVSTARLLGVMLDYWIGYFAQIRGDLVRSNLVVFDRYYHDILVDSLRYRYGGPKWLLRALMFALPPWIVFFIILDAEEDVVYSRKQEVTLSEIRRQRAAYRELSIQLPFALLLRTDCGIERCSDQALRAIAGHLGRWFQDSFRY